MKQRRSLRCGGNRPKAFWGAIIGAAASVAGSLIGGASKKKQERLQASKEDYDQSLQEAQSQSTALNQSLDYQNDYYNQFRTAARYGRRTLSNGGTKVAITDGGSAQKIGDNTFLLRGGSHEDVNETGQTGIGIRVGNQQIEAEGGEVAQKTGNSLRIFSAQPILNGVSPAQAVKAGANKNAVFKAQERFKKNNHLKDDGSKAKWGTQEWINAAKSVGSYMPVIGTLEDAYELYRNPSWEQAGWTALGALSDIAGGRAIVKGLRLARNAKKAYNAKKTIINARKMINAKTKAEKTVTSGLILPGVDNIAQNNIDRLSNDFKRLGGGLTSKDRGSSKHPYSSVASKDFAGGNRSYPIPTKADAVDALRLAGLHGRSDVRAKVYNKYPELRNKKEMGGITDDLKRYWNVLTTNRNMASNIALLAAGRELARRKGKYSGGNFRGAGSGGSWTPIKPATKKFKYFNDAYDDAVKRKATTFTFGNKLYNTNRELNPYREMNNRFVGEHRDTTEVISRGKDYGIDYGPIPTRGVNIPWVEESSKKRLGGRPKAEIGTERTLNLDRGYRTKPLLERLGIKVGSDTKQMMQDIYNFTGMGADPYSDNNIDAAATPGLGRGKTTLKAVRAARRAATKKAAQTAAKATETAAPRYTYNPGEASNAKLPTQSKPYNYQSFYTDASNTARRTLSGSHFRSKMKDLGRGIGSAFDYVRDKVSNLKHKATEETAKAYSEFKPNAAERAFSKGVDKIMAKNEAIKRAKNIKNIRTSQGYYTKEEAERGATAWNTARNITKYGIPGVAGLAGYMALPSGNKSNNKPTTSVQKDAKGQPISQYIARPVAPAKTNKSVTKAKPAAKVVSKPSTTKLYGLNDNESKVVNGQVYVRRGNQVFNTTTKVRYDYNNGKYTGKSKSYGVGDYSKIGKNFNDAFDAARAAGAREFRYNAGKYNQYSTAKESDAKKEALNRKVGAKRIAKRLGGTSRPIKEMRLGGHARPRFKNGGNSKGYSYGDVDWNVVGRNEGVSNGIIPWQENNNYNVKYPYPITDSTPTIDYKPESTVSTQSAGSNNGTKELSTDKTNTHFTKGDYIGLGIDSAAALATGIINANSAGRYTLPERAGFIQAGKLRTTYNVNPQVEEIQRARARMSAETFRNTASSVGALNRANILNVNATEDINKLLAEKENKETELINQDVLNQQSVSEKNVTNQMAYNDKVADIMNAANQSRANAINASLSGLSQAWTNFYTAGRTAFEDDQARIAAIAASEKGSLSRMLLSGYQLPDDTLARLYNNETNPNTRRLILSSMSARNRRKLGLS